MPPDAPTTIAGWSVAAAPTSTVKSSGTRATTPATWPISPFESLSPTMFGWAASAATASGVMLRPVTFVKL